MPTPTVFVTIKYKDAPAAAAFLEAVGFHKVAVYENADDPSRYDHAQYTWGEAGGVMFGSAGPGDETGAHAVAYCVCESDDAVQRAYERALEAGAGSVYAPRDPGYGGREFAITDPEGNQWSFGSYAGEQQAG